MTEKLPPKPKQFNPVPINKLSYEELEDKYQIIHDALCRTEENEHRLEAEVKDYRRILSMYNNAVEIAEILGKRAESAEAEAKRLTDELYLEKESTRNYVLSHANCVEKLQDRLAKAQAHFLTFPMDATMEYEELYQRAVHWWGDLGTILDIEKSLGGSE